MNSIQTYASSSIGNAVEFANTESKSLYTQIDLRANLDELSTLNLDRDLIQNVEDQARSVAAFIDERSLIKNKDNYQLDQGVPRLDQYLQRKCNHQSISLGENEKFRDEPVAALGTAFLVGEKTIITAAHHICPNGNNGHFVDRKIIETQYVVFGFLKKDGLCQRIFPMQDVYKIRKVIAYKHQLSKENFHDWALLKLDREVVGRKPLDLNVNHKLAQDCQLYMLGHPMGLALKFTRNGYVKKNDDKGHFEANLDAFHGNSGSPVFDLKSRTVVGILCRGQGKDYEIAQNYQGTKEPKIQAEHLSDKNIKAYEICQRISSLDFVEIYLLAHQNASFAQEKLGLFYITEFDGNSDSIFEKEIKAYKWLKKAADTDKKCILASLMMEGYPFLDKVSSEDIPKAIEYLDRRKEKDPKYLYFLGLCYEKISRYDEAYKYFLVASEKGHSEAQLSLAIYYLKGKNDIKKNAHEALKWLTEAEKNGNTHAWRFLAYLYSGIYSQVPENLELAFIYFKKTADRCSEQHESFQKMLGDQAETERSVFEKAYIQSQFILGLCYLEGHGVEISIQDAISHLGKAASLGYAEAFYPLYLAQKERGYSEKADVWFQKAIASNKIPKVPILRKNLVKKYSKEFIEQKLKWEKESTSLKKVPRLKKFFKSAITFLASEFRNSSIYESFEELSQNIEELRNLSNAK